MFKMKDFDKTITITNKNEEFSNTGYCDIPFTITAKPLTKNLTKIITKKSMRKRGDFDIIEYKSNIFINCVISWTGIKDDNSGEEIECTEENKKIIDERYQSFVNCVVNAISNHYDNEMRELNEDFEEEVKN